MIKKMLAVLIGLSVAALLSIGLAGPATANQTTQPATIDPTTTPLTGTLSDGSGAVQGTFAVQRFITAPDGTAQAVGSFTGTITDGSGAVTQGTQDLAIPVDLAQSSGSCQILDLVLGPLNLDLLGLQVHLDTVHLNLTAQAGAGNLVGNLLCAIAGLLDGPLPLSAVLSQIVALLNQLLGALA